VKLETFFEKFDQFADAPDAISKMREVILQLAAHGKLIEQSSDDEPASELVGKIEKHIEYLRSQKAFRGSAVEALDQEQLPEIPPSWEWVRLGNVADYGSSNKAESSNIPEDAWLLDLEDIERDTSRLLRRKSFRDSPSKSTKTAFAVDDVLYGKLRPYLNKIIVADAPGYCTTEIIPIRAFGFIDPAYICHALKRPEFIAYANSKSYGMNLPRLGTDDARRAPFPLPPLAEQKRIVAKVDELMALCDRLEVQQQERETQHAALARASLARFAEAPTPANLQYLFHPSYTITPADLRKSILILAVQGKLVPQDPEDGETRAVSMEKLVGRKNLKNGLSLSPIDGASDFVCLPLSAMKGSTIDCSFGKPIAITAARAAPYLVKPRDIFIIRGNGSKERVGIAGMVRSSPPNVLFPDLFIRVPLPPDKIEGDYFLIAWNSAVTRELLESLATTTSGIWKVNQGHISECEIPLPPLAEQRRIVAKVDQLMSMVDKLETQLAASRATAANLLSAIVAELTAPANAEA
jgi:type I restriction enzyme, S subunit